MIKPNKVSTGSQPKLYCLYSKASDPLRVSSVNALQGGGGTRSISYISFNGIEKQAGRQLRIPLRRSASVQSCFGAVMTCPEGKRCTYLEAFIITTHSRGLGSGTKAILTSCCCIFFLCV